MKKRFIIHVNDAGTEAFTDEYVHSLEAALKLARNHIVNHHDCSKRVEWGGFCPVCHHEDGTEPELDAIANALEGIATPKARIQ